MDATGQKIKLLLVEDNLELCDILTNFFQLTGEAAVCGTAHDGEEALRQIHLHRPDVVLLDLIMPKLDGISVLERLKSDPPPQMPAVIVTSAIGQEKITAKALTLGASYYMIKPYNLSDLLQRIFMVLKPAEKKPPERKDTRQNDTTVIRQVMDLGVPTNLLGYQYIVSAVKIMLREERACSIAKQVYAEIAKENSTTVECVESAVRKTIQRIYENNGEGYRAVMRLGGAEEDKRPTNGRFLTLLAQKIRLEQGEE